MESIEYVKVKPTLLESSSNVCYIVSESTARQGTFADVFSNRTIFLLPSNASIFDIKGNDKYGLFNYSIPSIEFNNIKDVDFISQLQEIENRDSLKAIEKFYNYIDPIIESKDYLRVDAIGLLMIYFGVRIELVVSFLTITHARKDSLKCIGDLINYVKANSEKEGLNELQIESILKGF